MGKTGENVTVNGCTLKLEDYPPGINCLVMSNEAWVNSFGNIFQGLFDSPSLASGNTPFVVMFERMEHDPVGQPGVYNYRIVDKFHMNSVDNGDQDDRPAGSDGAKDLIDFKIGASKPAFNALAPFLTRRVADHTAPASTFTASVASATPLDIGSTIDLKFSRKAIGLGNAANLMWGVGASAPVAFTAAESAYNNGAGKLAIDTYLDPAIGERLRISPAESTLVSNAGKTLDIYSAPDTADPAKSKITDTEGNLFVGPDVSAPKKIGSVAIGKPNLFVRANIGENGSHSGTLSNSPDIVIFHDTAPSEASLRTQLQNPAYNSMICDIYDKPSLGPARANRIFTRSFNSGTMRTKNLKTVLYYTDPGTIRLPSPAAWKPVCNSGSAPQEFLVGQELSAGSVASPTIAVSNEFIWNDNLPTFQTNPAVMDANHFCFITMTASDNDWIYPGTVAPIPTLSELVSRVTTFEQFCDFVRLRNVAWKNFMLIEYHDKASSSAPGDEEDLDDFDFGKFVNPKWVDGRHLRIPIRLPVGKERELIHLEVNNNLPAAWKIDLSTRKDFAICGKTALRSTLWKEKDNFVKFESMRRGVNLVPDIVTEKNVQGGIFIDVDLPELVTSGSYPVELVQKYKGREIGRLSIIIKMPRKILRPKIRLQRHRRK